MRDRIEMMVENWPVDWLGMSRRQAVDEIEELNSAAITSVCGQCNGRGTMPSFCEPMICGGCYGKGFVTVQR